MVHPVFRPPRDQRSLSDLKASGGHLARSFATAVEEALVGAAEAAFVAAGAAVSER